MAENPYSKDIVDAIANYLKKLQNEEVMFFSFDELNEQIGRFSGFIPLPGLIKRVNYEILVRDDSYIVMVISPIGADQEDKEMMDRFRDFFTRVNWDLDFGNFLFGETYGEIAYRYSVDCKGVSPNEDIICDSIIIPALMLNRYSPGIIGIISGSSSVEEAILRCENSNDWILRILLNSDSSVEDLNDILSILDNKEFLEIEEEVLEEKDTLDNNKFISEDN